MSTTITETEQRTSMIEKSPTFDIKRSTFIRTASIEKLRKFNNFVCSQHYYLLPGILLWLKTTLLKSTLEKSLYYLKTLSYVLIVRDTIQDQTQSLKDVTTKKLQNAYEQLNNYFFILYEQFKRFLLIITVYLSTTLIALNAIGCVYYISIKIPPIGFFFLIACVLILSRIKYEILNKINDDNIKNMSKKVVVKNISKIKLF